MAKGLQKLVVSLQVEISNLRTQVRTVMPTAQKDFSLSSLIPRLSGTEMSVSVEEFFELVRSSAEIGCRSESDKIHVTVSKITKVAKAFLSSSPELHNTEISWEDFKAKFLHRFGDVRSDQYHLRQIQTARKRKTKIHRKFWTVVVL
jgi:hypothetical protein